MSFLAPLFLAGALAVALPILFHLIRRTTREKIPFSSLLFLLPTPPRVTTRSRLDNLWLLLLRCLVICLLALGFARPFFPQPVAADATSSQRQQCLVLVDASASMQRQGLWAEARQRAARALEELMPGDEAALYLFDQQLRPLVTLEQWNAMAPEERTAVSLQKLESTAPGWAATHLAEALTGAAELFEQQSATPGSTQRRIVVISDLQQGARLSALQGYEWPRGVKVSLELLRTGKPSNAGLQLVPDREESSTNTTQTPHLRVSNAADSQREQFQLMWASVQESPGAARVPAQPVYVPAGQSRIIPAPMPTAAVTAGEWRLSGDDEAFDNTVTYVATPPDRVKILYLGNEPDQEPAQPLYFLSRALQPTRTRSIELLHRPAEAPLTPADTSEARLAIVTEVVPAQRISFLKNFLAQGKTVLGVMKSADLAATVSALSGEAVAATEAPGGNYAMLGQIEFQHPIFVPFADPRYSDFTKIHFWKHRRMDLPAASTARVLARFDDQSPALVQWAVGPGNLFVLAAGWHPADSQLALSTKFVPLLYSFLEQSGSIKTPAAQYFVGQEVPLPAGTGSLRVRRPDGREESVEAGAPFRNTTTPGLYTVVSLATPFRFAVNLAPEESNTTPLPADELERLGVPVMVPVSAAALQAEQAARQHLQAVEVEARQKLWRWLIVAALLVLWVETWLAGKLTRRIAPEPKAAT